MQASLRWRRGALNMVWQRQRPEARRSAPSSSRIVQRVFGIGPLQIRYQNPFSIELRHWYKAETSSMCPPLGFGYVYFFSQPFQLRTLFLGSYTQQQLQWLMLMFAKCAVTIVFPPFSARLVPPPSAMIVGPSRSNTSLGRRLLMEGRT